MIYHNFELLRFFNLFYENFINGLNSYKANTDEEQNLFNIFNEALKINLKKYKSSQIEKFPNEFKDNVYSMYKKIYEIKNNSAE